MPEQYVMPDHVRAAIDLLLRNGGRIDNNILKEEMTKFFDRDYVYIKWREITKDLKDEPLRIGIVLLPVGRDWVLNPDDIETSRWLQMTTGWILTQSLRMLRVISIAKYRQSPIIQQHAENFKQISELADEVYQKLRAETGYDSEPNDIENGDV
jgi:hypothetical protein